jgi:hypothetical protein
MTDDGRFLALLATLGLIGAAAVRKRGARSVFTEAEQAAQAKVDALRVRLAKATDDPDWREHLQELLARAQADLRSAHALSAASAVNQAWRGLDQKHELANAEALAEAIRAAGGPKTLRVWRKDGVGTRIYFPGEVGFLTVSADGSVSEKLRGRLTFQVSGLYPAWARAVKAGRSAYMASLGDRLHAMGQARVKTAERVRGKGRGSKSGTVGIKEVLRQLSGRAWDVGDQGQDDGFVIHHGRDSYLVWIEGWGPECVDEATCDARTMKKIRKGAAAWIETRRPDEGLVTEGRGDAVLVSLSGFLLTPQEAGLAVESRGEEAVIELQTGSRSFVRKGRTRTDMPLKKRAEGLLEELMERAKTHARGKDLRDEYRFDIKTGYPSVPEWVEMKMKPNQVDEATWERAREDIEYHVEWYREDDFPWLAKKWSTEGRSGGWLVLSDDTDTAANLDSLLERWPGEHWDQDEEMDEQERETIITDKEYRDDLMKAAARADAILADIEKLEKRIRRDVASWTAMMSSDEWWQQTLDLTDDEVQALKDAS